MQLRGDGTHCDEASFLSVFCATAYVYATFARAAPLICKTVDCPFFLPSMSSTSGSAWLKDSPAWARRRAAACLAPIGTEGGAE